MRWWSRALKRALEGWIHLLDSLGAKGVRWEWKKRSWRQALEERLAAWENLERGVRSRVRMCRACRTLVEQNESICPSCGASMRAVPKGGPGRLARLVLPMTGSLSMVLVSANIGMSLLVLALWGTSGETGGIMSLLSPPRQALYVLGAKWGPAIIGGEIWRLVTAGYLHGGLIHLMFNCYALMNLGPLIEDSFGWRRLLLIYFCAGAAGFSLSAIVYPMVPSIGASASIFGLLGFAIVFGRYRGGASGRALSQYLSRWLIFAAIMLFIPRIDNAAHLGGGLAGAILGLFLDPEDRASAEGEAWVRIFTWVAILATIGSFFAMSLAYPANLRLFSS